MTWFCKHDWAEVARTVVSPYLDNFKKARGWGAKGVLERAARGSTTILWQCRKCQKLRKAEMRGQPAEVKP